MTASPERLEGTVDPKLLEILVCPLTKGPLEFDADEAGIDLAFRKTRLPDPRRHPDHAAGRGAEDRVSMRLASFPRDRCAAIACVLGNDVAALQTPRPSTALAPRPIVQPPGG